ncbi:MAG: histidine phosphatase family protein [Clostridia bacterium]|nr:histidine phosphatase family protein [Clostridia bacterium]
MKNIICVQHTESVHHTNGMVGSWTDWELSEKGITQAQTIADKLRKELSCEKFTIYTSDLRRAFMTAEIIGEALGVKTQKKSELRERNLGKCCGKSVAWLKEHKEHEEYTIDDRLFSDAESRRDEWNRLKPFFDEIISNDEENIIIVSHGDLLGVFTAMFLGMPAEALNSFDFNGKAGGVSVFRVDNDGKRRMRKFNDLSYME